ncbi:MAG: hypothetical protein WDN46_08275 [Methylocella sp.]
MATNENDLLNAVTGSLGQLLGAGSIGAVVGAIAIVVVALIKRQPPMAVLIDARMKILIDSYQKHIDACEKIITGYMEQVDDLKHQVDELAATIDRLNNELDKAREQRGFRV